MPAIEVTRSGLPRAADRTQPHHPVRGRFNAAFFHGVDWYMHWKYGPLKSRLFDGLPPLVLEIGAGTGANFRYLRRGTRVIAAEPNSYMHAWLAARARRYGIDLDLRAARAEALPVPDASVEAVVASLVLCTVEDPQAAVAEVLRVLRPGGRFVCIEHVAAPPDSAIGRLQRAVYRPWQWCFEGCHTHRDTGALLERAGFSRLTMQPFTWNSAFLPVRPQIAAVCVK